MKSRLACLAICLILISVAFETPSVAAKVKPAGLPFALSLEIVPAKLPADGNRYPAAIVSLIDNGGLPSYPISFVTVYLSSSQENVATIDQSVIIKPGMTYGIANLTTTVTPGSTVITASSPGLQTISKVATTTTPSGFPSRLKVFVAPSTVVARPNSNGVIIVELLDQKGLPAKAGSDLQVQLISSSIRLANVSQSSLLLQAGQIETFGSYATTFRPGAASITASSPGLLSGAATVTITGPAPFLLKVFVQPSKLPLSTVAPLTIAVTDTNGNPARAPADIIVQVRSSNLTVATVPLQATIRAGNIYVISNITTTSHAGSATVTVSSTGLVTASTTLKSFVALTPAIKLNVEIAPTVVLADASSYNTIVVSLETTQGNPAFSPASTIVQLTSSNSQVGSVPPTATIPANKNFVTVLFGSTYFSGATTITASASNLQSDQQAQNTFGPVPTKLALKGLPPTLPADGNHYQALEVLLEDSAGNPAVAPVDLIVQLLSTASSVAAVDPTVVIPAGSLFAITGLLTSTLPGKTNISASAQGFSTSALAVTTQIPAPSNLASFVAPSKGVISGVSAKPLLIVQLQDSSGNPARARSDTSVIVTSSNSLELPSPISLTIPKGADYLFTFLDAKANGTATLTVTSPGLVTSSSKLDLRSPSVTATIAPVFKSIFTNQTVSLKVTLAAEGQALSGAEVSWNATLGALDSDKSITSPTGISTVLFTPSGSASGNAKVFAMVSHPALGTIVLKSTIALSAPTQRTPPTLLQVLFSYLIFIIPAVAVVVGVALFVTFRRRRRKAREELEAGFQTLS